jgi:hypothetical protein
MSKIKQKSVRVLLTAVAIMALLSISIVIALNSSYVQNEIRKKVVSSLSEKLGTRLEIAKLSFRPFSHFLLRDVYLEDQQKDTLLYVHEVNVGLNFWQLFFNKVSVNSARLNNFTFHLKSDTLGHTNLDFVIKAFAPANGKTSKSKMEFHIKTLQLGDGRFTFDKDKQQRHNRNFDPAHIDVKDLQLNLSLNRFSSDTLSADIHSLSFHERSGLTVTKLQTHIRGNGKSLSMPLLSLALPHSTLTIRNLSFVYDSVSNLHHITQKVKIGCRVQPSDITPADLTAFLPQLGKLTHPFSLSTDLTGTISNFRCRNLNITDTGGFRFSGNFDVNGLPDIGETFVYAHVGQFNVTTSHLQDLLAGITGTPVTLPQEILRLGVLRFNGSLTGFFSEMVAYGNFATRLGNVSTDLKLSFSDDMERLQYSGRIKTSNFRLGELLGKQDVMGNITIGAEMQGVSQTGKPAYLAAKATVASFTYKNYTYNNLTFDGVFDGPKFDGKASLHDENISMDLTGLIDVTKQRPVYQFSADVQHFKPHNLNLISNYPELNTGFRIAANLQGDLMKDAEGTVSLKDLSIVNDKKSFYMESLDIQAQQVSKDANSLQISSSLVNGHCQGRYNFLKLPDDITYIAANYLPSILKADDTHKPYNNFSYNLAADPGQLQNLADVLGLPWKADQGATVEGTVNSEARRLSLILDMPSLFSGSSHFTRVRLKCDNPNNTLAVTFNGILMQKNDILNLFASVSAANDSVNTRFMWDNASKVTFAGEVVARTKLSNTDNRLTAVTSILPTQIILNDSAWNIRPGRISTDMKSVRIEHLALEHHSQHLSIEGTLSDQMSDSLNIDLGSIQLEQFCQIVALQNPSLRGNATGKIVLYSAFRQPVFKTNVLARDFGLNGAVWGDAYAVSSWDAVNHKMDATGTVINKRDTVAHLAGSYYPANDSLAFFGRAHNLPINFLNTYLEGFLTNPQGLATGNIAMLGPTKRLWFEGDIAMKNAQAGLSYLNTQYFFADTVHMRHGSITLNNIKIRDAENHTGTLTCTATNTNLKNWHYTVNINADNMLALNTREDDNENFWGKAYASGTVRITGDDKSTLVNINATSNPRTEVYISTGGAVVAADNSFIDFVAPPKNRDRQTQPVLNNDDKQTSTHETVINATLNLTPDAQVQIIVDPKAGDRINAMGTGTLNISYKLRNSELQMRGNYTLSSGNYLLTIQNALSREFKIDDGSIIRWNGPATNPQIDINARYQLNASLADLMDADLLKSSSNRTNVLVECLLNLTGNLLHPDIRFDIDLPNSREEIKRSVRSIISTSDMMNRQIIYLLALGKFYTPDYLRNSTANPLGQNELISFASSTLSNQLNNWMSQAFKGVNVGFNWRRSGIGETAGNDYEAAIMYQNNRWIINGNVGYRDDNYSTSKFIGDLDVQYLLTQNGKWRIRFYNRTNDYKQLNQALYTQGLGLTFTESFNSIPFLVDSWEVIKALFRRQSTQKNQKQ